MRRSSTALGLRLLRSPFSSKAPPHAQTEQLSLSHVNAHGKAVMVDVSEKGITKRVALAKSTIHIPAVVMEAIELNLVKKGDVLTVAEIAGIQAAKCTSTLIPLCHPLPLSSANVDFVLDHHTCAVHAYALAVTTAQTGVEMEAMVGANIATLTVYDMVKGMDKTCYLGETRLLFKSGGKSGVQNFIRATDDIPAALRAHLTAPEDPEE